MMFGLLLGCDEIGLLFILVMALIEVFVLMMCLFVGLLLCRVLDFGFWVWFHAELCF